MPTYEYECRRCGHLFEEFQSITAPPRSRCPRCRGKVERLISAGAGIVFKGSGFYVTDARKSQQDKSRGDRGSSPSQATEGKDKTKSSDQGRSSEPAKNSEPTKTASKADNAGPAKNHSSRD
jgi:putative FmdB family regulatory protein